MCLYSNSQELIYPGIKSKRQKKRAIKEDKTKRIIQLLKRQKELALFYKSLPLVPLETPYQLGWKRTFVLIKEERDAPQAAFYNEILDYINTVQYCSDGSFKEKVHKRSRRPKVSRVQKLHEPNCYQWNCKNPLNEKQKSLFSARERLSACGTLWITCFVFNEPWRFELKIEPYIITHQKPHAPDIKSELKRIDNFLDRNYWWPHVWRLTDAHQRYHFRSHTSLEEFKFHEIINAEEREFFAHNNELHA